MLATVKQPLRRLRGGSCDANRICDLRQSLEKIRPGQCDGPRLHEVDARMMPQNAHCPLPRDAAGAFPALRRRMAHRAEALSIHPAPASSGAIIIARRSAFSLLTRARRIFN